MKIWPKNWGEFQHYKDRSPGWIKLHKYLLDDYDFHSLPVASRALAPCLWLLASESENAEITLDINKIAFRMRMNADDLVESLMPLIDKGFFLISPDASEVLADRYQCACLEKRREREEKETYKPEKEKSTQTAKPQTLSPAATPLATKKVDDHIGVAWLVEKGVDEQAATDWLKVRKTKRAPLTLSAWNLLVTEAEKAGITPADAVKIAAEKSWQSFVAEYMQNSKTAQVKTNALQFTTNDYNRGINADGSF